MKSFSVAQTIASLLVLLNIVNGELSNAQTKEQLSSGPLSIAPEASKTITIVWIVEYGQTFAEGL